MPREALLSGATRWEENLIEGLEKRLGARYVAFL